MKVILSTRNPSKAEQIKAVFDGMSISVLTLEETLIEGEAVEDGETLYDNAFKKAVYAMAANNFERTNSETWSMADDTGFFITALNGAPGVKAARWAGDVATEEITKHTLRKLEGVTDRSASFKTVVVLLSPEGDEYVFEGEVSGTILTEPRVKPQPKMPYSGIFVPEGSDLVWAQMSVELENSISHRGKAFRKVRSFLETLLQ